MQVKSIAECSNGSILKFNLSIFIKLPFVYKIYVLSIFEWPFYTGLTVYNGTGGLNCGHNRPLYPYYVCISSQGPGETALASHQSVSNKI